ncbi:mitochondrial carrier domain-containing protein [Daedaleopsis nitida]|nr:mitochondrial carrier domain-containing protein [Daedaleopsis nitida]
MGEKLLAVNIDFVLPAPFHRSVTSRPDSSAVDLERKVSSAAGRVAGCVAVTFSNSAEVAKTRMQLQGEFVRVKDGGRTGKVYRNVHDVLAKTWTNEGIRGTPRGLGPTYFYRVALNGCRLGLYEPLRKWSNARLGCSPAQQVVLTSMAMGAGSLSTVVGCELPSLVLSSELLAATGTVHAWHAFATVVRMEGAKGLLRGWDAAVLRGAIGGSVRGGSD